jgi:hypothetical protein
MQSLAKRHEDRARRIADNSAERGNFGDPALSVGSVALAYEQYFTLRSRLGDAELAELDTAIEGIEGSLDGVRSLAEAPDGSGRTMAGIGVVNPAVVPAAVLAASDDGKGHNVGNDAGWGETKPVTVAGLPESEVDPAKGNLNGQAIAEQVGDAGGWGTTGTPSSAELRGNGGGTGGGSETGGTGNGDESKS